MVFGATVQPVKPLGRVLVLAILPLFSTLWGQSPPAIANVISLDGYGDLPTFASGSYLQINGTNLCNPGCTARTWSASDFTNNGLNAPTALDGVRVSVNGKPAFVEYISSTQLNVQAPEDSTAGSKVNITVTNSLGTSAAFPLLKSAIAPGLLAPNTPSFNYNGKQYLVAIIPDATLPLGYAFVGAASFSSAPYFFRPAKPGDTLTAFGIGFGDVTATGGASILPGVAATQSNQINAVVKLSLGSTPVPLTYDGLYPTYIGLYEFTFTVPSSLASGDYQVNMTVNGAAIAQTLYLTVQGSTPPAFRTFYVAPNGNDSWSGTLAAPNPANTDGPLATLDHARAVVQSLNKTGASQVSVQFRAGTYFLPATEQFTSADSGTASTKIVYQNYPGESPVFSGGVRVQNWSNVGGNTWKATLPVSTQYFENLYYNGARRLRPRLGGYLGTYYRYASTVYLNAPGPPAKAPDANCPVYISGSGWECFDRFQYDPKDPIASTWKNLAPAAGNPCNQPAGNPGIGGDVEMLTWQQFSTSKLRVSCVDTANHLVYFTGTTGINQTRPQFGGFVTGNRYLVENVQDALTQPGQFFVDRSTSPWTLTYLANPGENPNADMVIAPHLSQLLVASGLQYVTFQGLTFEHDNYVIPAAGHKSSEMEPDIAGAISFQNTQHVTFDSNTVTQISGTGLEFISCVSAASPNDCVTTNATGTTANNVIENSAFYDLGVLGVLIGHPYTNSDNDANTPQLNVVQNNVVEGYGRTLPASFGIAQGSGHDNLYTHNDVYDGYHTAVSVSEAAGDTTRPNGVGNANNTISFNHVYNLFQGIMNDGGAIRIESGNSVYTAPGNKILNNKIHDVSDSSIMDASGYGGNGIYLDNQTGLVDVENNLVYRVSANPMFTPQGPAAPNQASTVKNNIFAYGRGAMVAISDPYTNGVPATIPLVWNFTNNLVYFDRDNSSIPKFFVQGGCLYAGGVAFTQFQFFNSNLYWRTDGTFATDPKAFAVQPLPDTKGKSPCSANTNDWTFYTVAQWKQTVAEDLQSVVQNPGFKNPAYPADDYSLPQGSPGIGFVVFDPNQAGRSNPVIKPPAVPATFPTMLFNPAKDF